MADGPAAVRAHGWGWRHASRRAWAVRNVTLRIAPGERVLLLGASGSGKSTLLHGLAGVLGGADEGEMAGDLRVDDLPAQDAAGRAALVLQDPDSQAVLARVGDDVAFGCENLGIPRDEIWQRVRDALDAVGLDVPLDHSTSRLSGGQKQRLALAGAIAMGPGLLLLDEPTANLDPEGVAEVRDAVARHLDRTGATLVVVEHRTDVWLPLVDRVIVLEAGQVVADSAPAQVLERDGARLAASGVWVPGHPPVEPRAFAPTAPSGELLLRGEDLAVARVRGVPVAEHLAPQVRAGAALAITGPNGAGKTTLGLTLAGLLPPASGRVVATPALQDAGEGAESGPERRGRAQPGDEPFGWTSRQLLTRIGTVFQDPEHQLLARTVREELAIGPRALGLPQAEIDARCDELLERLRLTALARANPYTLSGGEKRRLTVASALATRPRVLILDEPTFGQDAVTWAELVALLAGLRDGGSAVVAVTHDEPLVEALGADVFRLSRSSS